MGYTHFYTQQRDATQREWNAVRNTWNYLYHLGLFPEIWYESDINERPQADDDIICFNGVEDDGHETMLLQREVPVSNFCKTARKPYDLAVVTLLLIAHHHAPDVWDISSDGTPEDWAEGLALVRKYVHPDITLPPAVLEE